MLRGFVAYHRFIVIMISSYTIEKQSMPVGNTLY